MATYNLTATDLITLLNSTVTTPTGKAILDSVSSAFDTAFPFGNTSVQTTTGPADTAPSTYAITYNDTVAAGVQLDLIVVPGSTAVTGAPFTAGQAGTSMQTAITPITLTTAGGVVLAAGDQFTSLLDKNMGTAADTLIGGAYQEKLFSLSGNNVLVGGTGANTLQGGSGQDTLIGGGMSILQSGSSGTGAAVLKSSTMAGGHDTLRGGAGADSLQAQDGDNRLLAGTGANTLVGGSGHDTLIGGHNTFIKLNDGATRVVESIAGAHDTILAGSGSDTVVFATGLTGIGASISGSTGGLRVVDASGSNTIQGGLGGDTVLLANFFGQNPTVSNTANQTITAGTGGVRIVTAESSANYAVTQTGSTYNVQFSDSGQKLTINDASGSGVTIVFGDGSPAAHI